MGWTSTDARFYTADGKVNRKAECDALYTWEGETTKNEVIKSSMRGSVYYAAVQTTDKNTGSKEVFAVVCLTSTRWDGGFNFGYKGMTEDMGPCEDDCPKGILDILTDTESKYAKEWRERCRAKLRDKKQSCQSLSSVKIGEVIEFEYGGRTIRAEKMAPAYQFKTPWFKVVGELEYIAKTRIKDWRIVAEEEANEPVKHISEIMETCRLHDEETGEETDEYRYYKWLAYCHTSGNYRTIADKALAEALTGIYVAAYRKGKGHIIAMNKDGVLIETVISSQPAETPRISTETAETVNVSAEGEKAAERAENKPTFTEVAQMVQTELAKNNAMHTAWHLEFPDGTECDMRYKCTVAGCDFYEYTEARNGEDTFKDYKATENDITLYICQQLDMDVLEPPQSPGCIADAPKPRETARKPQNRGIGSRRHSGLGVNGYAMLDNASATLAAMYVPRECFTAEAAHW